jgi:hypothetical protein
MNSLTLSRAHRKLDGARRCIILFKKWALKIPILWVDAYTTFSSKISSQNADSVSAGIQNLTSTTVSSRAVRVVEVRVCKTLFADKRRFL